MKGTIIVILALIRLAARGVLPAIPRGDSC